ncbi:FKBP14 [Branchiostoma lanceolatum]|uniref:peptidylprolyl isomerase n=1 Tax=Branchiostoma lanceolatum TaxID=7740 RepID=A0A8K0AEU3_BRALA|nr:FKBP14 [Branchiostoma lanceolatum]
MASPRSKHVPKLSALATLLFLVGSAVGGEIKWDSERLKKMASAGTKVETLKMPRRCDRRVGAHDKVVFHYNRMMVTGEKIDSSRDRGEPMSFVVGWGKASKEWEDAVNNMCIGEVRQVEMPGEDGMSTILVVDLIDIQAPPPTPNVFKLIDKNDDKQLTKKEITAYLTGRMGLEKAEETDFIKKVFKEEDKDNNGVITMEEFSGPKQPHTEL